MKFLALWALCFSLIAPVRAADGLPPDVLVKNVTNEVLEILRTDQDIQAGSTKRVVDLVEQKVFPHFNFVRMTGLAVGREWRQATPEQQKSLAEAFHLLLVRTYANALVAYRDQTIQFKPFRMQPEDKDVIVRSQILQPAGKPLSLDYSLEKTDDGWKVYDVVVAGASLVSNYRTSFAQEIRSRGIDGLIQTLEAKNKRLESKVSTSRADAK